MKILTVINIILISIHVALSIGSTFKERIAPEADNLHPLAILTYTAIFAIIAAFLLLSLGN